jgi:DNA-nicking Smr family endonuclease
LKKKISLKDKKDWEKFIKSSDKLENKDLNYYETIRNVNKKTIDLHGYTLDEANNKIKDFIDKSFLEGVNIINVITGKGSRSKNKEDPYQSADLGILKYSVPEYIRNNKELMKKVKSIDLKSIYDETKGNFNIILKKNL